MAFPVVAARITGRTTNTNTTTHAITLPSGVVAGNLLVVVFSTDGNPTVTAQQAGWTKLNQASNGTVVTGAIFWKVATGSDALTLITTAAEASSHASFRITGGGTPTATSATATSTNSNPPAHTPPSGLRDYLWIATRSGDSTTVATAAPANYTNLQTQAAQGINGASTNTAERSLAATAQDPGTFTSASIAWQAWTIAVPPANATAVPVLVVSTASVALPTVVVPQVRTMAVVASTAAVATPTLATHYPAVVASAASVATPNPAKSTTVPALVTSTTTVATPATPRLAATTVLVASTASVALPTVIGSQARSMAAAEATSSVGAPTVATHYPVTVASTAVVATPTVATRYPVSIASTSLVATPTVIIRVAPTTVVNQPSRLVPSTTLAPSASRLPSAGGDRFFPPTATVNLWITVLPDLVVSTPTVNAPTVVPGAATVTPTLVESATAVGDIAAVDTVTLHLYPRLLTRAVIPAANLAPSAGLVPADDSGAVFPPTVWRGAPQTISDIETVSSTATVHAPSTPTVMLFPRLLTGAVVPGGTLATSTGLVPAAALSKVFPPGAVPAVVFPATIPPSNGPPLYPAPDLYPGPDLYPSGTQALAPTLRMGTVQVAPELIPSGSVVHPPTPSGSGVNFVPLFTLAPIASTSVVEAPTLWVAETTIELEFLDTEESVEAPSIVRQGETLLLAGHVGPGSSVALPTLSTGPVQVRPILVSTASAVALPEIAGLQIHIPQTVTSSSVVGLLRVRGAEPPRTPYPDGHFAGAPVTSSGPGAGAPVLVAAGFRAGAPTPV